MHRCRLMPLIANSFHLVGRNAQPYQAVQQRPV